MRRTRKLFSHSTKYTQLTSTNYTRLLTIVIVAFTLWKYNKLFLPKKQLKIACWILRTNSSDSILRSAAIRNSWGKYCDELEFIDSNTPGIKVQWIDTYEDISAKSFCAWHFMFDKYVNNIPRSKRADFIVKADTDTYIIGPNMRHYLSQFDPGSLYYIGRKLVNQRGQAFVAGTAIILSAATLQLFVNANLADLKFCAFKQFRSHRQAEDLALSRCLKTLGVHPHGTQDDTGAERFMVLSPDVMRLGGSNSGFPKWYLRYSANTKLGPGCCSTEAIAFHYVSLAELSLRLIFANDTWLWQNISAV